MSPGGLNSVASGAAGEDVSGVAESCVLAPPPEGELVGEEELGAVVALVVGLVLEPVVELVPELQPAARTARTTSAATLEAGVDRMQPT